MERYSSFEQLKERASSGTLNPALAETNDKQITNFIDLLRASVIITANDSTEPVNPRNKEANFTENAR